MSLSPDQQIIDELTANWIWTPGWVDSSTSNTAGRIVRFKKHFNLSTCPSTTILHFSADTRYKLFINGRRVAVGPTRSSPLIWYYDTLDIAPYLTVGSNELVFVVLRYFASVRAAMPFERTAVPGLTVIGQITTQLDEVNLCSGEGWIGQIDDNIQFPMGLIDDVFLHINERVTSEKPSLALIPKTYQVNTLNGELAPWRLRKRCIPMPEETPIRIKCVCASQSTISPAAWIEFLLSNSNLSLEADSLHVLELQADVHSTAFLCWTFFAAKKSQIVMKVSYSEGYELEPRSYPFFRSKADRLDAKNGRLIGPHDEVAIDVPEQTQVTYEPFWFRTFRIMRLELKIGKAPVELRSFEVTQVNYPMAVKASWSTPADAYSQKIWDISIRTMRNCMFDGYSDCPFYEQLQYSCDSRSVGLFHYLLSGDDRLMRQSLDNFAASVTVEGLTQSRFPSHVKQIIAGFSLYWILQISDHHLFFGDTKYTRFFLPRVDGVLEFFDAHVDDLGLVSGLPSDVWQYVDWVTTWGATNAHPDKGVPTNGRQSNRHTYFSMLYAYVLKEAALLVRAVGRHGHADEYDYRADKLVEAIRQHCYDGQYFTDSTVDVLGEDAYSQHCQVFAVLCGAALPADRCRILTKSFTDKRFAQCSYMMKFYALRALSIAGDEAYEGAWKSMWDPWRIMVDKNLSTWEEDDVRQRSDCHAWGSVPIYEYCVELAGIRPCGPGCSEIMFRPRLHLSDTLDARVALGKDNLATVSWVTHEDGNMLIELRLERPAKISSRLPGKGVVEHGTTDHLNLVFKK